MPPCNTNSNANNRPPKPSTLVPEPAVFGVDMKAYDTPLRDGLHHDCDDCDAPLCAISHGLSANGRSGVFQLYLERTPGRILDV